MRFVLFILLLTALLAGLPARGRAESSPDADLASQATEILLLERMARDTDDPEVRAAAKRQIGRLERDARTRAREELGRDLFRERPISTLETAERNGIGLRNVRMFGGREVRSPRRAIDPSGALSDRERGVLREGRSDGDRNGGSARDREDGHDEGDGRGESDGRDEEDDRGPGSMDEEEEPSHFEQDDEDDIGRDAGDEDRMEFFEREEEHDAR